MSIDKLYTCIKENKVNTSYAREAIYSLLMESEACLSVADITRKLEEGNSKKISLNTIYRHLTFFIKCKLAIVVQDDFKKSYYILTTDKARIFSLCTKCNKIDLLDAKCHNGELLEHLKNFEFVTVHKRCIRCIDK